MNDLEITIQGGELRVLDTDLAERLGFGQPRDIRKLINRHADALQQLGRRARVAHRPERGGHEEIRDYLNRKQAIFITAKSETPEATEITIEIVNRFDDYERGAIGAPQQTDLMSVLEDPAKMRYLLLTHVEARMEAEAKVKELQPAADAYERIAIGADGSLCPTDAAKTLNMRPKDLFAWLLKNKWAYRRAGNAHWVAYQDKIQSGYLEHKVTEVTRSDGSLKITEQMRVTAKGLAKLAAMMAKADA